MMGADDKDDDNDELLCVCVCVCVCVYVNSPGRLHLPGLAGLSGNR